MKKISWIIKKTLINCSPYILINIIIILFVASIGLAVNLINKNIINELINCIEFGKLNSKFFTIICIYIGVYLIHSASGFLNVFGTNFCRFKIDKLFYDIFIRKAYYTEQEKFLSTKFLEEFSFVRDNISKISQYINTIINIIFSNVFSIISSIVIFIIYSPILVFYFIFVGMLSFILAYYSSKNEYDLEKRQIKEQMFASYYKNILTSKNYARELRIYKTKEFIYKKWKSNFLKLKNEKLNLEIKKVKLNNIIVLIKILLRFLSVIILVIDIYNSRYDLGTFVMLFGLTETCAIQINRLVSFMISGSKKDNKYLENYYDFIFEDGYNIEGYNINTKKLPFGIFDKLIVKNVSYMYPNSSQLALKNISFELNRGEIITILGYNGSGKTTLSKIITGSIEPLEGEVYINNELITREKKFDAYKYFGLAPQEYSKFYISIKEYVGLGRVEEMYNDEELENAYKKTNLNSILNNLSDYDETKLGKELYENGIDLSIGEWQKLVLSSAYMGNPEIIIMDEPTASIDPIKEMEIIENFRKDIKGKSAILISHRIGFARLADKIIVMSEGKIIEQGTHDELVSQNGYYAEIFYKQKNLYHEE